MFHCQANRTSTAPRRRALAVVVAALIGSTGCSAQSGPSDKPLPLPDGKDPLLQPGPQSVRIANYTITAKFDPKLHHIHASETLTWRNTGNHPVERLPFHLYMNAFKNDQSVFMKESHGRHRSAKASDTGWGFIAVTSIRSGSDDLTSAMSFPGPDETVMELALPGPLAPGETITLDIAFETRLPKVFARTGYRGDFHMVGQWFPKIGVLTAGSKAIPAQQKTQADGTVVEIAATAPGPDVWHCEPFHLNSEFFADFGVYEVSLTVPNAYTVAATGVLLEATQNDNGSRTLRYRAEDVHDFAWMADPWMQMISATAKIPQGDVEVRVYHRPQQKNFAQRHLRAGVGAIAEFSKRFTPYPWAIMSIIDPPPEAASGAGGMEYPTLVTTAADHALIGDGARFPEFVTVHEIGHNWFQGILASNEVDEAWLDEGVNEYADALVMMSLYGVDATMVDQWGLSFAPFASHRARLSRLPSPIATKSYEFADNGAYSAASYAKTAVALRTLSGVVGHTRFESAMKDYAQRYAFRHPTGKEFFASLEKSLGEPVDWFVTPAFDERGVTDFQVRSSGCRKKIKPRGFFGSGDDLTTEPPDATEPKGYECSVVVVNHGTVPVPVDIELRYVNAAPTIHRWDPRQSGENPHFHRIDVDTMSKLESVVIDPHGRVPLDISYGENARRQQPDSRAVRRAAARIQYWTQTLMQVNGL